MQGGSGKEMQAGSGKVIKGGSGQSGGLRVDRVLEFEEEHSDLVKEIMALGRERKDLLECLTPSLSHWKQIEQIQSSEAATTWRKENTSSVSSSHKANTQHELEGYFDSILEDVTDLGHRMLSMAHVINESDLSMDVSSWCKATELFNMTSKLMQVSKEFYEDTKKEEEEWLEWMVRDLSREFYQATKKKEEEEFECIKRAVSKKSYKLAKEEEEEELEWMKRAVSKRVSTRSKETEMSQQEGHVGDFVYLCHNYLGKPWNYKNELVLILTEKEKEKERVMEEEEAEEVKEKKEKEKDPSTVEFLKMVMGYHQKIFAEHRACWERVWGSNIGRCGGFGDTTSLSSMHFTHYTPSAFPSHAAALSGSTLQIYYIKIRKRNDILKWPLEVYGVVAARDTVDRNRNIIFSRSKHNHQVITEKDPFLRLTGPSRAILAVDPVDFEVKLKINKAWISLHQSYSHRSSTPLLFDCPDYEAELGVGRLATPLQATIVGIRFVEGVWPFEHGCRVVCYSSAAPAEEVVLLDHPGEIMCVGSDGYLHLSRNVVSVEFYGRVRVDIHAYSESGCQAEGDHVDFYAQHCQISSRRLSVGNCKLEVVVAWSLLVKEKLDLLVDHPAQP